MIQSVEQGIKTIIVDGPRNYNALSSSVFTKLVADFQKVCPDPDTRAIIFRGAKAAGKKVEFISPFAGADLRGLVNLAEHAPISKEDARAHLQEGLDAIRAIRNACQRTDQRGREDYPGRVPVTTIVDGWCLAGGLELVLGISDFVIGTSRSIFGMREIGLGGIGGWGGPQALRRILINPLWVNEILLAAGPLENGDIDAVTAYTRGLLNRLIDDPDVLEGEAVKMAQHLAALDPMAVTRNLDAADYTGPDCTSQVTDWMIGLMLQPAWVNKTCIFLEGRSKR